MKTRDRILAGALALFNEEGVGELSALDIATALEMSPGHLYYHFRGKSEIVAALFEAHEAEIALVAAAAMSELGQPGAGPAELNIHLRILLEEVHDARFLYRESAALTLAWPDLQPRYRRLFSAIRGLLGAVLDLVAAAAELPADPARRSMLAEQLMLMVTTHASQMQTIGDPDPPRTQVARAAAQMQSLIAAFTQRPSGRRRSRP